MTQIPTARGDTIDAKDVGFSLMTECIIGPSDAEIQNNWPQFTVADMPDSVAVEKLITAKQHGVDTILDRVIAPTGRNVVRVKRIAEQVPVNIIVGTGWHTARSNQDFPRFFAWAEEGLDYDAWESEDKDYFRERTKEFAKYRPWPTLEQVMLMDIQEGIMGTGVRAGFIKCATDDRGLTPGVERVIRACARVHRQTGVFITTHTGPGIGAPLGALQQGLLKECGVDLSRVILGHLDWTPPTVPIDDFVKLADQGSLLSFDTLRMAYMFPPSWAEKRIERIVELCKRGYAEHVLISHDDSTWHDVQPQPPSPFPTYCEISLDFIPKLKEHGITDQQIVQITRGNPQRIFESNGRGGY